MKISGFCDKNLWQSIAIATIRMKLVDLDELLERRNSQE